MMNTHDYWMKKALDLAAYASSIGEVPVGAVIVKDENIISTGYNLRETNKQSTAHAELIAINEACKKLNSWRLEGCILYVTLEPCPMCAGAIINSRVPMVVYGCYDNKSGCFGSMLDFNTYNFNHKPEIIAGVLKDECSAIIKQFFKSIRK